MMNVLYSSKGISKGATKKKLISIIVCLVIAFAMIIIGSSKTKGPSQLISVGGGSAHRVSFDKNRFSADQQKAMAALSLGFGMVALFDAALLAGCRVSWTEITETTIKGSYMGKTVSCSMSDVKKISQFGEHLFIEGPAGKFGLITEDPKKAREIIESKI